MNTFECRYIINRNLYGRDWVELYFDIRLQMFVFKNRMGVYVLIKVLKERVGIDKVTNLIIDIWLNKK